LNSLIVPLNKSVSIGSLPVIQYLSSTISVLSKNIQ
jgi:hypothetical protein